MATLDPGVIGADGFGGVLGDCADVLGSVCSAAGGRRAAPSTVSSNCTYKVHKTMKEHSSANLAHIYASTWSDNRHTLIEVNQKVAMQTRWAGMMTENTTYIKTILAWTSTDLASSVFMLLVLVFGSYKSHLV